jgi:hypothetical protein
MNAVSGTIVVRLLVRLTVWITTEVSVVADTSLGGTDVLVEGLTTTADEIIAAMSTTRLMARVLAVANLHQFHCAPNSYAFPIFQNLDLAITKLILQSWRIFTLSPIKKGV